MTCNADLHAAIRRPARSRINAVLVSTSVALAAALSAFGAQAAGDATATAVASLIVQLRPAERRQALLAAPDPAAETGEARRGRLDQLLASRGLPLRTGRALAGDWHVVDAGRMLGMREARAHAAQLRADPRVAAVALNLREQRLRTPDDPLFVSTNASEVQWWLQAASGVGNAGVPGLPAAWDRTTGAQGLVAVLDSGVTSHAELNPKLVPGHDFVQDADYANDGDGRDNDPSDPGDALPAALIAAQPGLYGGCSAAESSSWHGTLIAGQIGAVSNNGLGATAIDWSARVLPVRVAGRCGAAVADIVDGMRWAAGLAVAGMPLNANPARILTLSYGSEESCDPGSADPNVADTARLYRQVIDELRRHGALVFAAAGNQNGAVGRPASCGGVVAVASLNRQGFKSKYSNYGPQVALATVGGDDDTGQSCDSEVADTGIVSTANLGDVSPGPAGYAAGSGTSFAAPVAAGVASLMLALRPELTPEQLEDGLKRSARPHADVAWLGACAAGNALRCACTTATCGAGTLDAEQALAYAAEPAAYVAPSRVAVVVDNPGIRACAALLGRPAPTVPGAPEPVPPTPPPPAGESGGGGGALGPGWLAGLALAVVLLGFRPGGSSGAVVT